VSARVLTLAPSAKLSGSECEQKHAVAGLALDAAVRQMRFASIGIGVPLRDDESAQSTLFSLVSKINK
jgi:hypothetical protein